MTVNDTDRVRALMGEDPLGGLSVELDDRARRDWLRIVATPRPRRTRIGRPRLSRPSLMAAGAAGTAAVALLAVVGLPGTHAAPAQAATPPVLPITTHAIGRSAVSALKAIAANAARQSVPAVHGPYQYIRVQTWNLDTAVTHGTVQSRLEAVQQETWLLPNGTGRLVRRPGDDLEQLGTPEHLTEDGRGATDDLRVGSPGTTAQPLLDLDSLPYGNPVAFATTVEHETAGVPIAEGPHVFDAVAALFEGQLVSPASRARVWTMLASVPGVVDRGAIVDRTGRAGIAFTVNDDGRSFGLPQQDVLVVDPSTGQPLEYDQVLTQSAGALNVTIPAVLKVVVFGAASTVANDNART